MSSRIYPVFPGLSYTVTKTPNWATRMQRSISGRTLRTSDYVNPIWTFKLIYAVLHDSPWCAQTSPTELRKMMDFFNSSGGAFDSFLLLDPSDNTVTGQVLPLATSTVTGFSIGAGGTGYDVDMTLQANLGTGTPATWLVTAVSGGVVTGLTQLDPGRYSIVPDPSSVTTTMVLPVGAIPGTGCTINVTWTTTVQLVRSLASGGFAEAIIAPNTLNALYYNGISVSAVFVDPATGLVTLAAPFAGVSTQPTITADFTYYFRVYFPDALDFEEFAYQYWQVRQVKLTSVVL